MDRKFTMRCKAFSSGSVRWYRVAVDEHGVVRVWDPGARYYSPYHSLGRSALLRIKRHAEWLNGIATNNMIDAAPDMLAALRAAVTVLTGWECTHKLDEADTPTVRLCKAALAKAEGKSMTP